MQGFLARLAPIWRPHPGQLEFLRSVAKFKVLACGRRWGKTDACAVKVMESIHQPEPARHLLLAPTLDQARILFDRLVELLEALIHREQTEEPVKVRQTPFPNLTYLGHRVIARSGHLARALRGNEANHIVVDEAAYVPETLITEIALPMLATTDGGITLISTPNGYNHFWRFFQMGERGENGIWCRGAPSRENPNIRSEFLDVQRQLIAPRAFDVEYEAKFVETEGRVFRSAAIEACTIPVLPPVEGDYFIGVDWARYSDATAIVVVNGHRKRALVCEVASMFDVDWKSQVDRVNTIVERYPGALVVCDATSGGDAITDMLREALPQHRVQPFVFTRPAKIGLIGTLAGLFEADAVRMTPDPRLLGELEAFEMHPNGKLEARGSAHDDLVIALALAASALPTPYPSSIQLIERA